MADQPLGNLDNPAFRARFRSYPRPTEYEKRQQKPQIVSDIGDQFSSVYQSKLNEAQPARPQQSIQPSAPKINPLLISGRQSNTVQNTVPVRQPQNNNHTHNVVTQNAPQSIPLASQQIQPNPVQYPQQYTQQPLQVQPHPKIQNQQIVQQPPSRVEPVRKSLLIAGSRFTSSKKPTSDNELEREIIAELDNEYVPQQVAAQVDDSQQRVDQMANVPVYFNNYNGEYEDKKYRKLSLKYLRPSKNTLIFASSAMATLLIAGSFFAFMNWNNTKNVANAAAAKTSIASSTSANQASTASVIAPSSTQIENYSVGPNLPKYLIIPKLNIFSMITPVNLNSHSFLEAPNNIYNTGWWQSSSEPGQEGATILDGFTTNGLQPGVFANLTRLTTGDTFQVERGDGTKFTYQVSKETEFGTNNLTMDEAISPVSTTTPGLNIITCSEQSTTCPSSLNGDFVVFAQQVE